MVKIKELSEDLRLRIVTGNKEGKGYKTISKQFQVPVPTVQSIIKKYKKFHTVKNLKGRGHKPSKKSTVRGQQQSKDHHQGHPEESE